MLDGPFEGCWRGRSEVTPNALQYDIIYFSIKEFESACCLSVELVSRNQQPFVLPVTKLWQEVNQRPRGLCFCPSRTRRRSLPLQFSFLCHLITCWTVDCWLKQPTSDSLVRWLLSDAAAVNLRGMFRTCWNFPHLLEAVKAGGVLTGHVRTCNTQLIVWIQRRLMSTFLEPLKEASHFFADGVNNNNYVENVMFVLSFKKKSAETFRTSLLGSAFTAIVPLRAAGFPRGRDTHHHRSSCEAQTRNPDQMSRL